MPKVGTKSRKSVSELSVINKEKNHFVVSTDIAISDQFYGWIAGFRKMARIVSPADVVTDFQKFLDDISCKYETDQ